MKKETKVIYLNEEDRPKFEEPLSLVSFYEKIRNDTNGWHHENYYMQNAYAEKWLEYRKDFKDNHKPIEFKLAWYQDSWKETSQVPSYFENIWYRGNGLFWCWNSETEIPCVFKGNLNNGKVK